jgi:hypothetical protein
MNIVLRRYLVAVGVFLMLPGVPLAADAKDTGGKFRIEPSLFAGGGLTKIDVGQNTKGDRVSISGGGGAGAGLTLGYGIAPRIDIDVTLGYEKGQLTPPAENATGSFSRTFYLATLLYRIPLGDRSDLKVGGGGGIYKPGNLDIDATGVANGSHDVITYENANGAHAVVAFEMFFADEMSLAFGLKYYSVTYKESSATRNGAPGFTFGSKVENLDGSGVDLSVSLAKYF